MPGDEKIPSDEKLYPVIWEARNKVCTHIHKNSIWAWTKLTNTANSVYTFPAVCIPLYNYLAQAWPK